MARKTVPGKFSASFTTPDGDILKASGGMDPLTSMVGIALITTDRERDPKVVKAMLDLLLAMDVTLPASLVAEVERYYGTFGEAQVHLFKLAGGRVQ